jgi:hypothetical protein
LSANLFAIAAFGAIVVEVLAGRNLDGAMLGFLYLSDFNPLEWGASQDM